MAPYLKTIDSNANLILVSAGVAVLDNTSGPLRQLKNACPSEMLLGCSTAGEIPDVHVHDETMVATFVSFEKSSVEGAMVSLSESDSDAEAGENQAANG